jgi:hypothetical protein
MVEIRELQVKDIFTVAKILSKVGRAARQELMATAKGEQNAQALGMEIIMTLFTEAEEDVKGWLADVAKMKVEDFSAQPPSFLFDVIEALKEQGGFQDFLSKLTKLLEGNKQKPKK